MLYSGGSGLDRPTAPSHLLLCFNYYITCTHCNSVLQLEQMRLCKLVVMKLRTPIYVVFNGEHNSYIYSTTVLCEGIVRLAIEETWLVRLAC